jgi:hypothetical protein
MARRFLGSLERVDYFMGRLSKFCDESLMVSLRFYTGSTRTGIILKRTVRVLYWWVRLLTTSTAIILLTISPKKLNEQPQAKDWNHFLPYARCVRKITLSAAFRVDSSVLVALAHAQLSASAYSIESNVQQRGLCLLPQLKELSWRYHCNESDCWSAMLFLSPTITKLVMQPVERLDFEEHNGGDLASTFVPVLRHALSTCKKISSLSIFANVPVGPSQYDVYEFLDEHPDHWAEYNWQEIADILFPFFQNGPPLEELVLSNANLATPHVLRFLRSLPTLRSLELGRPQCPLKYDSVMALRDATESSPAAFSFRSLSDLDLTSSLETAVEFIRWFTHPSTRCASLFFVPVKAVAWHCGSM